MWAFALLVIGTSGSLQASHFAGAEFKIDSVDYTSTGLRRYIQHRQDEVKARWGDKDMLLVLIKPLPGTNYKHMVDVLDEMMISQVKRYAIMKPDTPVDSMVVSLVRESLNNSITPLVGR